MRKLVWILKPDDEVTKVIAEAMREGELPSKVVVTKSRDAVGVTRAGALSLLALAISKEAAAEAYYALITMTVFFTVPVKSLIELAKAWKAKGG